MIKRPKQVERSQKSYLSNERYQDYSEQQFKTIYDYLDGEEDIIKNITELMEGTVLYESDSYSASGVLNDNITNYKRIKVYATSSDSHNLMNEMLTSQIDSNNNLITSFWAGSYSDMYYGRTARVILNGTGFTVDRGYYIVVNGSNVSSGAFSTAFKVVKIIGFKF